MGSFRFQVSVSLDGYLAGPNQSVENPLGVGGEQLHEWVTGLEAWRRPHGLEGGEVNASTPVIEEAQANVGATVMGRNMFGGGPGPWGEDPPWNGWWGDVLLGGGASAIQQYLAAGLIDEFELHIVPVLLGNGERLLEKAISGSSRCARSRPRASPTSSTTSSDRRNNPRRHPEGHDHQLHKPGAGPHHAP